MSRRSKRYERRQEKRQSKRLKALAENLKFENISSYTSLYEAERLSAKGVRWKASVQKYELNLFSNLYKTRKDLIEQKDVRKGFICFTINERGKERNIRSVRFEERVTQKSLCKNALYPVMTYNLIADNGASQKGKGMHYATQRLIKSLKDYYKKYGSEGYVLTLDFKSYFDNIEHKILKSIMRKYFEDKNILKLSDDFINAFGDKGLGLGSETSQISAIAYINEIDHYIKEIAKIKGYGRYMDDSYILHNDKEKLKALLEKLTILYEKYGIKLNNKKTQIRKIKNGFTFLKTRFYLTDTGKIIKKPCRESITRERRKLKKQAKLYEKGVLPLSSIEQSFQSWLGSMKHRNAKRTVRSMTALYNKLFTVIKE